SPPRSALGPPPAPAGPPRPHLPWGRPSGGPGPAGRAPGGRGPPPIAAAARHAGVGGLLVPAANAAEAALAGGPLVIGVDTLADAVAHLCGERPRSATTVDATALLASAPPSTGDLADVRGQPHAKRPLEVAAAGSHTLPTP